MSRSRILLATACAALAGVPAGVALAAQVADAPPAQPRALRAPLVAERSVGDQMRAHGAAQRRARARRQILSSPVLRRIAECESHNDPRAIGGGGLYRGAFQFSRSTWAAVGGKGDPAAAPLDEQYRRAAILLERSGPGQWPVCGQ